MLRLVEAAAIAVQIKQSRWDFLSPWLRPLFRRLQLVTDTYAIVPTVGLRVKLSLVYDLNPHAFTLLRQALVLLCVLAGIDREGFKHVLGSSCGLWLTVDQKFAIEEAIEPIFIEVAVLTPKSNIDEVTQASVYTTACFPALRAGDLALCGSDHARLAVILKRFFCYDGQAMSKGFADVARRVAGSADSSRLKVNVPVRVNVEPGESYDETLFRLFFEENTTYYDTDFAELIAWTMLDIRTLYQGWRFPMAWDFDDDHFEWTLDIKNVGFATNINELTPLLISPLQDLVTRGVGIRISKLQLSYHADSGYFGDALKLTTDFFERILCAGPEITKIDNLTILNLSVSRLVIQRLFSAFAETRSTRSLTLRLNEVSETAMLQPKLWEGVAYAFFSKHAHSSIKQLTIQGDLISLSSAERVAAVLSAENPTKLIFGNCKESDAKSRHLQPTLVEGRYMLREGTRVFFKRLEEFNASQNATNVSPRELYGNDRKNEESKSVFELETDVIGVRVVSKVETDQNSEPYVKVLVPAYGICWVLAKDMVEIPSYRETPPGRSQHPGGITDLKLSFKRPHYTTLTLDGLSRLLQVIGGSLTRLALSIPNTEAPLDIIHLLDSCPRLKSLKIKRGVVNARTLVEYCNIHRRWFSELDCRFTDTQALIDELRDNNSLFTRNLKRLTTATTGTESQETCLEAIEEMLESNRTLQRLIITTSLMMRRDTSLIKSFHGKHLQTAPLPLASRLAFLSVFRVTRDAKPAKRSKNDAETDSPTRRPFPLDPDVLSIIFAFAADRARRCISIKSPKIGQ